MNSEHRRLSPDYPRIHRLDWLLIFGFVLSPMTGLRIWKIGPAETLTLAWVVLTLLPSISGNKVSRSNRWIAIYWIFFLVCAITGALICVTILPLQAQPSGLLTWIYFAIVSTGVLIGCSHRTRPYLERLLVTASATATLWYAGLYLVGLRMPTFLGAPLWYESSHRFTGGADNPHQLALLLSVLLFVTVRTLWKKHSVRQRLLGAGLITIILLLGASTDVSSFWVAIGIPLGLLPFFVKSRFLPSMTHRVAMSFVMLPFFVLVWVLVGMNDHLWAFVESDPNGLGRLELWASFGDTLNASPLFGLGPGTHGQGGTIEYHSAYLEIMAMTGIIGLAIFLWFTIQCFQRIWTDPTLMAVVLPLYVYGLSGFTVRRLAFWITLMIVVAIGQSTRDETACRAPLSALKRRAPRQASRGAHGARDVRFHLPIQSQGWGQ